MALFRTHTNGKQRASELDRLTQSVKDIVAKENAATDEKTARLRAQRLAKEAKPPAEVAKPAGKKRR